MGQLNHCYSHPPHNKVQVMLKYCYLVWYKLYQVHCTGYFIHVYILFSAAMSARSVQTGHSVVDQNATTDRPLFQREGKTSSNVVQSTDCPLEMRRSAVEWPPNSPDLSPCDYWMFNQAKRKSQRFASIGEAKVENEWNTRYSIHGIVMTAVSKIDSGSRALYELIDVITLHHGWPDLPKSHICPREYSGSVSTKWTHLVVFSPVAQLFMPLPDFKVQLGI